MNWISYTSILPIALCTGSTLGLSFSLCIMGETVPSIHTCSDFLCQGETDSYQEGVSGHDGLMDTVTGGTTQECFEWMVTTPPNPLIVSWGRELLLTRQDSSERGGPEAGWSGSKGSHQCCNYVFPTSPVVLATWGLYKTFITFQLSDFLFSCYLQTLKLVQWLSHLTSY